MKLSEEDKATMVTLEMEKANTFLNQADYTMYYICTK